MMLDSDQGRLVRSPWIAWMKPIIVIVIIITRASEAGENMRERMMSLLQ
jgi:hypothetical protein